MDGLNPLELRGRTREAVDMTGVALSVEGLESGEVPGTESGAVEVRGMFIAVEVPADLVVAVEELELKALCSLLTINLTVSRSGFLRGCDIPFAEVITTSVDAGRCDIGCALDVDWHSDEFAGGSVDIISSLSPPPRRGVSSAASSCSRDPLMIAFNSFAAATKLIPGDPKTCSISSQESGMSFYQLSYVQRTLDDITEVTSKFSAL
jgi:hypothetical protein